MRAVLRSECLAAAEKKNQQLGLRLRGDDRRVGLPAGVKQWPGVDPKFVASRAWKESMTMVFRPLMKVVEVESVFGGRWGVSDGGDAGQG